MTPLAIALNLIHKADKITLLTHYKPDPDGISACAALDHILRKMGKTVQAVYPTLPDLIIKRQPLDVQVNTHTLQPDLLIACDTANYDRLYYPDIFKNIPLINIDHHISNSIQGTVNIVNGVAASTCEELFYLAQEWFGELFDTYTAECLLYGILYDTQVFRTQMTTARTMDSAMGCINRGANLFSLSRELLTHKHATMIKLWGEVLGRLVIDESKNAAWAQVHVEDLKRHNLDQDAMAGFVNFMADTSPLDVLIVFQETPDNKTKVSIRSKKRDINALAQQFGGGGHKNAAGVLMPMPIKEAVAALTGAV